MSERARKTPAKKPAAKTPKKPAAKAAKAPAKPAPKAAAKPAPKPAPVAAAPAKPAPITAAPTPAPAPKPVLAEVKAAPKPAPKPVVERLAPLDRKQPPKEPSLARAELLVREAWEKPNGRARVALARKAIAINSECADAWVLLGYFGEGNWQKRRQGFEKAVEVATRALGPGFQKIFKGRFWTDAETRPYMRAREGLGYSMWKTGDREKAINEYQALLKMNPHDDQGLRYRLSGWLLKTKRLNDLEELLAQFPDDPSAIWPFTQALMLFAKEGNTPRSRMALRAARFANRTIVDHLLGKKLIPPQPPEVIGMGDEREALAYALENLECWNLVPGAIAWLTANQND